MEYQKAYQAWDYLHEVSSIVSESQSRLEKGSCEYEHLDSMYTDVISLSCKLHRYLDREAKTA